MGLAGHTIFNCSMVITVYKKLNPMHSGKELSGQHQWLAAVFEHWVVFPPNTCNFPVL